MYPSIHPTNHQSSINPSIHPSIHLFIYPKYFLYYLYSTNEDIIVPSSILLNTNYINNIIKKLIYFPSSENYWLPSGAQYSIIVCYLWNWPFIGTMVWNPQKKVKKRNNLIKVALLKQNCGCWRQSCRFLHIFTYTDEGLF